MELKIERAMLVYQAGIANVFAVDCFAESPVGRNTRRLFQYDFRTCENIAKGLSMAGTEVATMHCNQAGDIIDSRWSAELTDAPFSNEFRPVFSKVITS